MNKVLFGIRMWLILLGTLLLFGGVLGMPWYHRLKMNEAMDRMATPPVSISTARAGTSRWQKSVQAIATPSAIHDAELATEVSRTVEQIYVENAADVQAGAVILALNSAPVPPRASPGG
jgi:membrane fusion protein (multidrug efflux system)